MLVYNLIQLLLNFLGSGSSLASGGMSTKINRVTETYSHSLCRSKVVPKTMILIQTFRQIRASGGNNLPVKVILYP